MAARATKGRPRSSQSTRGRCGQVLSADPAAAARAARCRCAIVLEWETWIENFVFRLLGGWGSTAAIGQCSSGVFAIVDGSATAVPECDCSASLCVEP